MEQTKNINEKKLGKEGKEGKVSYEQLQAYASSIASKAEALYKENQQLKNALAQLSYENNLRGLECAIKCLDHADMFSPEFNKAVVQRIEKILNPKEEEEEKEEGN